MSSFGGATQRYKPLSNSDQCEEYQQVKPDLAPKPPFKAIALALLLLSAGVAFLTLAALHFTGHFGGGIHTKDGAGWGFLVLGCLTFVPGFYETRIAYYTWRGVPGYSYTSIPTYD
ncbi:hypothetical protein WJX72_007284 [[Myrmecia] bisecta]|uniref:Transmembrane protein 230 n=1 Tax=[Myrmecia] bisecta TaxID=41462 RepID=A0AAW1PF41_9CHLO